MKWIATPVDVQRLFHLRSIRLGQRSYPFLKIFERAHHRFAPLWPQLIILARVTWRAGRLSEALTVLVNRLIMTGRAGHADAGHDLRSRLNAGQIAVPDSFNRAIRLAMTSTALLLGRFKGFDLLAVANHRVAARAFDFVLGHVHLMDEVTIVVLLHVLDFGVTGVAAVDRHEPVTGDRRLVAAAAINIPGEHVRMIVRAVGGGFADRRRVTVRALGQIRHFSGDGIGLEMTKKASRFRYGDMFALDDLRVAGRAAELPVATRLGEMRFMIEHHPFIILDTFEQACFVTLQASGVVNFRPRFRALVQAGHVISDHRERLKLVLNRALNSRRHVADGALDEIVRRRLPRFKIRPHHVARHAEAGC